MAEKLPEPIQSEVKRVWEIIKEIPALKEVGIQYISKLKGNFKGQFTEKELDEKRKIFEASYSVLTSDDNGG